MDVLIVGSVLSLMICVAALAIEWPRPTRR
jgi:hypothetical protein